MTLPARDGEYGAQAPGSSRARITIAVALAVLALVLVRTAWLADDAYISFRVVENLFDGHGLRWNTSERVQAYTNPLWVLVMCAARGLTGEVHVTALLLGLAVSLAAALVLVVRCASSWRGAVLGLAVLIVSRAFVDYSTSGLENPLTHLLLALFAAVLWRAEPGDGRALRNLTALAALATVNRMDALVLLAPSLFLAARGVPRGRALRALAVGALPFVAWEVFAVVYYGFPFPNTAYAKLGTGLPRAELLGQGLHYLADSLRNDPVTLLAVVAAAASALARRSWRAAGLAAGAVLYVAYVVWVGGDFMSGRFLAAPLFAAALVLARMPLAAGGRTWTALAAVLLAGLPGRPPNLWLGRELAGGGEPAHGIGDERRFYGEGTSLLRVLRREELPSHELRRLGLRMREGEERVRAAGTIGLPGYFAGPGVHVLDVMALADPLLARLPAHFDPGWRVGHFRRAIPEGYIRTLRAGENLLEDAEVAALYDELRTITAGGLLDGERWRAIVRMNLGTGRRFDVERQRFAEVSRTELSALAAGPLEVQRRGLALVLPAPSHARRLELVPVGDSDLVVLFVREDEVVGRAASESDPFPDARARLVLEVPGPARKQGFDELRLFGARHGAHYGIEALELVNQPGRGDDDRQE